MAKQKTKPVKPVRRSGFIARIRNNFFTGLVVVLPVFLTIYMLWAFVGFVDNRVLPLIPEQFNPRSYNDTNVRGAGLVVFLIFTTFVGSMMKGIFGRQLLRFGENMVDRVPVVRSIYNGAKQIVETITSSSDSNFDRACLVEYPRKGIWAIAFISTATSGELLTKSGQKAMYSVFLPTTPNPTSGFLLFLPAEDVIILEMDVEAAAKLVISAGLVMPPTAAEIKAAKAQGVRVGSSPKG